MQTSLKVILAFIFISLLGAGGLAFMANANANNAEAPQIAQSLEDSIEEDDLDEYDEDEDDDEDEQALLQEATVTPEEARQIAMSQVQGTIEEVEIEREDGQLVYEVEIDGQEVMIDALSGAVLEIEIDD